MISAVSMKRAAIACAAVAGLLAGASPARAQQPRWGTGPTPRSGACFYEDASFRGRYFCASLGQTWATLPSGMGDRISSIRTFGAVQITVFRNRSYGGESARFFDDVYNLKNQGWNDTISSLRVSQRGGGWGGGRPPSWGGGPLPRDGACFYRDSNFRGQYFCIPRGGSYASMPNGFNDKISSIRIIGSRVMIFADINYNGRSTRVSRDIPNLGSFWGDRISSIRVF